MGVCDLLVGLVGVFPRGVKYEDHVPERDVGEGDHISLNERIALLQHYKSLP